MTHNDLAHKPDTSGPISELAAFLDALYRSADPALWLELRCIDPTGQQKPKVLWTPVHRRDAILRQAEKLNHEGCGIYFAPCLRNARKGSAEAAVLLPALWMDIDCDNDPEQRETALARLQAFDPPPSAIFDSGGGWHSYWLLADPLILDSDEQRQRAAAILRGLFAALGGDPEYVKSVASIMRLPGSINTKPERGGVIVTALELDVTRRCPLTAFEWLRVEAGPPVDSRQPLAALDVPNALPRSALDYLAHGARDHTRNSRLFAAACQFRDAGYTQSQAEAELVPRYVADGHGENPTTREREARGSIASAYRRAARKSNRPRRKWLPRRRRRQKTASRTTRPVPDPASPAVPVEPLAVPNALQALPVVEEVYLVRDGKHCRLKRGQSGDAFFALANFNAHIEREILLTEDTGTTRYLEVTGQLDDGQRLPTVRLADDEFSQVKRWVMRHWGADAIIYGGQGSCEHLVSAIQANSAQKTTVAMRRHTGWYINDDLRAYLHTGGSLGSLDVVTELPAALACVNLPPCPEDPREAIRASLDFLSIAPPTVTTALWAAQFLAPLAVFGLPLEAVLWLHGETGARKTALSLVAASHYGHRVKSDLPQLFSTDNSLEKLTYLAKDTVLVLDDFPPQTDLLMAREMTKTLNRIVMAVGNQGGRSRLNDRLDMQQTYHPRGVVIGSAEHIPALTPSALARMFTISIQIDDVDNARLSEAQRHARAGVLAQAMSAYLCHLMQRWDELAVRVPADFEEGKRLAQISGQHLRLPQTVAALFVAAKVMIGLARRVGAIEEEERTALLQQCWEALLTNARETQAEVEAENPAEIGLHDLMGAVLSGIRSLVPRYASDDAPTLGGGPILGYYDEQYVHILRGPGYEYIAEAERRKGRTVGLKERELLKTWARQDYIEAYNGRPSGQCRVDRQYRPGDNREIVISFFRHLWQPVFENAPSHLESRIHPD